MQGGVRPGHLRMVPAQPREFRAVRANCWGRNKVSTAEDRHDFEGVTGCASVQRNRNKRVDRFTWVRVVLCNGINEAAYVCDFEVTIAHLAQGRKRNKFAVRIAGIECVDPAIKTVRKDNQSFRDRVGLATVLMDACAYVRQANAVDQRKNFRNRSH